MEGDAFPGVPFPNVHHYIYAYQEVKKIQDDLSKIPADKTVALVFSVYTAYNGANDGKQMQMVLEYCTLNNVNVVSVGFRQTDVEMADVFKQASRLRNLQMLDVDFNNMRPEDEVALCQLIEHSPTLKELSFSGGRLEKVLDSVLINRGIQKLKLSLKRIKMDQLVQVSEHIQKMNQLVQVGEHIKANKNLKSLSLSSTFYEFPFSTEDSEKWTHFCDCLTNSALVEIDICHNSLKSEYLFKFFRAALFTPTLKGITFGPWKDAKIETIEDNPEVILLIVQLLHRLSYFTWHEARIYKKESVNAIADAFETSYSLKFVGFYTWAGAAAGDLMDEEDFSKLKKSASRNTKIQKVDFLDEWTRHRKVPTILK